MSQVVLLESKKRLIQTLMQRSILLPPAFIQKLDEASISKLVSRLDDSSLPSVSSASDLLQVLRPDWSHQKAMQAVCSPSISSPQSSPSMFDPYKAGSPCPGRSHPQPISVNVDLGDISDRQRAMMESGEFKVRVISDYNEKPKKREMADFVAYFNARYKALEGLLRGRSELSGVISISRVLQKKGKENVSVIGMVMEKIVTPNTQSVILTLEDPTGTLRVLFSKKNPDIYAAVKDVCEDEVVGVIGSTGGSSDNPILFGNNLLVPDVPLTKELKKAPTDHPGYAAFISDMHVGSKQFMEDNFLKMVHWLKGTAGNEAQRALASQVKYLFIGGDLVDGVGIYPGQEEDLAIKDIYAQYRRVSELIAQLPDSIKIIMIPGNHDAMRLNEPQPSLYKDICKPVWDLPNAMLVSNPTVVNIHGNESFGGFDVLMYHGYSFDYYVANVESIRINGGYDRADLIMKYLLQRRHLAPAHTSTPYIPDSARDPLVISSVPDFFLTGHIHRTRVSSYRNVTLINGGCWQDITAFQIKTGHTPEPCRVSLMDLHTREVRLLRF
ncbi:MAG: DNA-directed DNA polymerase II small subunit [Nanoarchaeota archaeon]